jgi:DUF4097 and DUF4098 domain-containing protein YvlB
MKIDIMNGDLKCMLDSVKTLNAEISNGKADLNIGKTFSASFDLSVTNGKVTVGENIPGTNETKDKRSYKGKIGSSDSEVKVQLNNGKINLRYK